MIFIILSHLHHHKVYNHFRSTFHITRRTHWLYHRFWLSQIEVNNAIISRIQQGNQTSSADLFAYTAIARRTFFPSFFMERVIIARNNIDGLMKIVKSYHISDELRSCTNTENDPERCRHISRSCLSFKTNLQQYEKGFKIYITTNITEGLKSFRRSCF